MRLYVKTRRHFHIKAGVLEAAVVIKMQRSGLCVNAVTPRFLSSLYVRCCSAYLVRVLTPRQEWPVSGSDRRLYKRRFVRTLRQFPSPGKTLAIC